MPYRGSICQVMARAGTKDDGKIRPHFFQMEGFIEILCQKQVIETEIDAKGNHKNGDDPLLKGRILSAAAVEDPEAPVPAVPKVMHRLWNQFIPEKAKMAIMRRVIPR